MKAIQYRLLASMEHTSQIHDFFRKVAGPLPTNDDIRFVTKIFEHYCFTPNYGPYKPEEIFIAFMHTQIQIAVGLHRLPEIQTNKFEALTRRLIRINSHEIIRAREHGFESNLMPGWKRGLGYGTKIILLDKAQRMGAK
jgi:hypothetical protein